jgi:hypothetical protein
MEDAIVMRVQAYNKLFVFPAAILGQEIVERSGLNTGINSVNKSEGCVLSTSHNEASIIAQFEITFDDRV